MWLSWLAGSPRWSEGLVECLLLLWNLLDTDQLEEHSELVLILIRQLAHLQEWSLLLLKVRLADGHVVLLQVVLPAEGAAALADLVGSPIVRNDND